MQTITRAELLKAVEEVREAGGTTTHLLHTIARMSAGPAATPAQFEQVMRNVLDTGGFYYDDLSSEYKRTTGKTPYPHDTATFDDLTGDDQKRVIQLVINEIGDPDEAAEEPTPIVLADLLLDGLRIAMKLRAEHGEHFVTAAAKTRAALVALLLTQSVDSQLAMESIRHALKTGCGISEAVAEMDGQL